MPVLLPLLAVAQLTAASTLNLALFVSRDTAVGRNAIVFHEVKVPFVGPKNMQAGTARVTVYSSAALKIEGSVDYLGRKGPLLYSIQASGPNKLRYEMRLAEKLFSGTAPWSVENGVLVAGHEGFVVRQRADPQGIEVRVDSKGTSVTLHFTYGP